jgi:hypothetical protein
MVAVAADNDSDSLAFAERRGFVEERRKKGVTLALAAIETPGIESPEGVEIDRWAQQNDERNEPIRRLNGEFGYAPAIGRICLRGPVT